MFSQLKSAFTSAIDKTKGVLNTPVQDLWSKGVNAFKSAPSAPVIQQSVSGTRDRLVGVMLDMPLSRQERAAQSVGTKSGMFGIERWATREQNPFDVFNDFQKMGQMDETPTTPSFYNEVRNQARNQGRFDFDPLANMNRNRIGDNEEVRAPTLSRIERVLPAAMPAVEQTAQILPFRAPVRTQQPKSLADAWLSSPKSFNQMVADTRNNVHQTLALAA